MSSNSLTDIKKVTAAFKPTLNRACQVDEAFRVAAPAPAPVEEMALKPLHDEGGEKVLYTHASDTEREGVAAIHRAKKAIAGDTDHLHGGKIYRHWQGAKTVHKGTPGEAADQMEKDNDNVRKQIPRDAKYAESHGRALHVIKALRGLHPAFVEAQKKHPKPAAGAKPAAKAAPKAEPTGDAPSYLA